MDNLAKKSTIKSNYNLTLFTKNNKFIQLIIPTTISLRGHTRIILVSFEKKYQIMITS